MIPSAPYVITPLTLVANTPREIHGATNFVALISASVNLTALEVSLGNSDSWQPLYLGVSIEQLTGLEKVGIRSTVNQVVRIATGGAAIRDTRSAPSGGNLALDIVDVGGAGIGQKAMVGSVPVVLASNQSSIPVVNTPAVAGNWKYAAAAAGITNSAVAVTIKAAGGAGVKNYITGIEFVHEALGAATEFCIRDGAGGAVLWRSYIPVGVFGRVAVTFPSPLVGTAATLLEIVTLTASITGAVYCNAQGFSA